MVGFGISGNEPSGNACYHSVCSISSFYLFSKNLKIKIYKTIPVILYRCEA
jgi:hypothetical protein